MYTNLKPRLSSNLHSKSRTCLSNFIHSNLHAKLTNMSTDNSIAKQRLYFGYGSNLWKEQMSKRCPTSVYCGIARLKGYQWIINKRGYANIIQSSDTKSDYTNEVWGLVYALDDVGEALLDLSEGVPESYTKEDLAVDFWPVKGDNKPNVKAEPQRTEMLAYIDRKRLEPSVPRREYIYRM